MSEKEETVTFLSCFKCGRIVRSTDEECPRCGMKFGPGTLFECPFCAGLVWRNAEKCSTCMTDLIKFARQIKDGLEKFSMDGFVDELIEVELENIRRGARRVACPSCGLMIRGDEEYCPRCEMHLKDAKVDCPVCGEKLPITDQSCWSCSTVFSEISFVESGEKAKEIIEAVKERGSERADEEVDRIREVLTSARDTQTKKAKKPKKEPKRKKKKEKKKTRILRRKNKS